MPQEQKTQNKSIYHKQIEVRSDSDRLKAIYTLDVSPWEMGDSKGHTLRIDVQKLGQKPKSGYVNVDPSVLELKEALIEAFDSVEETE